MKRLLVIGAGLFALLMLAAALLGVRVSRDRADDARPHWRLRLPLTAGLVVEARTTTLLRAVTSPLALRLLDGRRIETTRGEFSFARRDDALSIRCVRCTVSIPELAPQALTIADATLRVRRDGDTLSGSLHTGRLRLDYTGVLEDESLALRWTLPSTELADALEPFRPAIPELARARLRGQLAAQGTLQLPQREASLVPVFEGLEVAGLGTEGLRFGNFSHLCRDATGATQRRTSGDGSPDWVGLDHVGKWLPRAVIAAEDAEFHRHPGYDLAELRRAQSGGRIGSGRGASTLTQQLAKNFFTGAEPTLTRKLRELLYAIEMERTLGKRRILTLYLNTVDWGPGICGATGAAKHYFGTTPAQLSPVQAAWLAGVLRNPQRAFRDEFVTARADEKRLRWVIDNMRLPVRVRRGAAAMPIFTVAAMQP